MPKTYTKKELLMALNIPNQPHLIDQWISRGIISPKKKKNGDRIYTDKHLVKLKEYKILLDSLREWNR